MPGATLRRSLTFRARHHYARREWDAAQNHAAFGDLSEPHEHDYRLTVWISGPMEPDTGFVMSLDDLDRALRDIVDPLRNGDLNALVPPVAQGSTLASCEALAHWFGGRIAEALPEGVELERVALDESDDLGAVVTRTGGGFA